MWNWVRSNWKWLIPAAIAFLILFAGNNWYEQATGRSAVADILAWVRTIASGSSTSPTEVRSEVAVTADQRTEDSTLPQVYDDFATCLDPLMWDRISIPSGIPPQIDADCMILNGDSGRTVAFVDGGQLVFSSLTSWEDGITNRQYSSECKIREIAIRLADFISTDRGWLGLTVDHPQKSPEVISIWIGRFSSSGDQIAVRYTDGHSPISAIDTAVELMPTVTNPVDAILKVRFELGQVDITFIGQDGMARHEVFAEGLANNFSVVFRVVGTGEFSSRIEDVYVTWDPAGCGLLGQ